MIMPVQIRPNGGVAIEILLPCTSSSIAPFPRTKTIGSARSQSRICVKDARHNADPVERVYALAFRS